ncbi:MAG TPA: tetratricopeptide repeat protein [Pirellulales bacterium]
MSEPETDSHSPGSKHSPGERLSAFVRGIMNRFSGIGRRKAFIALAVAASAVPLVIGLALWVVTSQRHAAVSHPPTIADARQAFDAHDDERARWISLALLGTPQIAADQRFWPPLLLGRLAARKAQQLFGNDQVRQYALAARYFAQASRRGLPKSEQAACLLEWGQNLYLAGQIAESVKILEQALHEPGCDTEAARLLLAKALCEQPEPALPAALLQLVEVLKSAKLPAADRDDALELAAQIEFQLGHLPQAIAQLEALSPAEDAKPETRLLRAQVLVAQATAEQTLVGGKPASKPAASWQAARAVLQPLATDITVSDATRSAAGYLIGRCDLGLGQPRAAAEAWTDVHHRHPFAAATLAARFELAELRHREGNDDQAAQLFHEAASQIEEEETENPWLSRDAAKRRIMATHQRLLEQRKFALAMELGKWFEMLCTEDERVQLGAQAHEAWGRHLQAQAEALPPAEAAGAHERAREQRVLAGDDYRHLAQLRFTTRQYGELLWLSAENYSAGHAYTESVAQWRAYLEVELRARRADALLELGRDLLTLGDPEEALLSLDDCIELEPSSVASFEARRLAAEAYLELHDVPRAQAVLEQTLNSEVLKPISQEWRQALMALARLLYHSGRLGEARVRLEEVVQRYPDAPFNVEARYLLATTCWKLTVAPAGAASDSKESAATADAAAAAASSPAAADTPGAPAAAATPTDSAPAAVPVVTVPPVDQLLATAGSQYAAVAATLSHRQEETPLSPWEAALLRNSHFGQGAVLFRQGRYEQAIQAYLAVVNRYYQSPEVLEAYTQIYACYRRLGRAAEARDALVLARAALAQLPPGASFTETTNHSRVQWGELFDTLARL